MSIDLTKLLLRQYALACQLARLKSAAGSRADLNRMLLDAHTIRTTLAITLQSEQARRAHGR